ncbi:MAG: class I SAM-dependent methyltransferase [Bacteroidia bacterium]|nr:class I SAM-dependent methyltransferase [Bacteroidia bacterium]
MKDNFSNHAAVYAKYRPVYPNSLFEFIYAQANGFENAWDAGTGNGQVSKVLSQKFKKVLATDISEKQLSHAQVLPNIVYLKAAEDVPQIQNASVDLITVAQAIHWFNRAAFYTEVKRVAKPNALVVVWCYSLAQVSAEIDFLINRFYTETIGAFWDEERRLVEQGYRTIEFPFKELPVPELSMDVYWEIEHVHGYLTSWSAVQHFIKANGFNPVDKLITELKPLWNGSMPVRFPLHIRAGRV